MAAIPFSELLWLSLDPDRKKYVEITPKSLTELCIRKLNEDLSLLTYCLPKLPKQIFGMMISSAIAQNRIFSVENLMRWCPYEKIELPVPDALKTLHTIPKRNLSIENVYEDFTRLAAMMLYVFFDLIDQNNTHSQLCCLDFGTVPIGREVYNLIGGFLAKLPRVRNFSRQYTLKCSVAVDKTTDLFMLSNCIEKAHALGLRFVVTGISCYNNYFPDLAILNFLEYLSVFDMELFVFSFSNLVPSVEPVFDALCSFNLIKYLNMSYSNALSTETTLRLFARTLNNFPCLERLVLKGVILTGHLSMLLHECCKKDHKEATDSKCCIVHNGTLKFLDVSICRLAGRDIEILRELALKNSLKYLNISENSLEVKSACETLLSLKCSLSVLEMNYCFYGHVEYDSKVFPLGVFKELRYLSMKGVEMTQRSEEMLTHELSKLLKRDIVYIVLDHFHL